MNSDVLSEVSDVKSEPPEYASSDTSAVIDQSGNAETKVPEGTYLSECAGGGHLLTDSDLGIGFSFESYLNSYADVYQQGNWDYKNKVSDNSSWDFCDVTDHPFELDINEVSFEAMQQQTSRNSDSGTPNVCEYTCSNTRHLQSLYEGYGGDFNAFLESGIELVSKIAKETVLPPFFSSPLYRSFVLDPLMPAASIVGFPLPSQSTNPDSLEEVSDT
ncbi:unnamed protein product [Strongylus vulgaris]|uniref:Uncharacterized protein n=1 Tax=Strongylus vulgaris TaxID=40348 RepID=A0A3P7IWE4_STRVU|nr:unnamed protein product [Strongylus vulgaris]